MSRRTIAPLGPRDRVILGGHDLEMREIARLMAAAGLGHAVIDRRLAWGARMGQVRRAIAATLRAGGRAVLVELVDDLPPTFDRRRLVIVDHHGRLAGANRPCSLAQVWRLLPKARRPAWTRRLRLVAVNDVAHIAGLRAAGATAEEIRDIRAADRRAQGVSAETERLSRLAVAAATRRGWLTIVETAAPTGSAVTDLMDPACGGPGADDLLVITARSVGFYGRGAVVLALAAEAPGSWSGGALPARGFWGAPRARFPDTAALAERILALEGR